MYKSEVIGLLSVFAFICAIGFAIWFAGASGDTSSWITYDQNGKHCITLYQSNNHAFSPDVKTSQNWCR